MSIKYFFSYEGLRSFFIQFPCLKGQHSFLLVELIVALFYSGQHVRHEALVLCTETHAGMPIANATILAGGSAWKKSP
jgi:hypothetical protein